MAYYASLGQTESPERLTARRLYDEGTAAFRSGDFTLSIQKFRQAYDTIPNPVVLIALANSYKADGNFAAMQVSAQRYLKAAPDGPLASQARELAAVSPGASKAPGAPPHIPAPPTSSSSGGGGTKTWVWVAAGAGVLGVIGLGWSLTRKR